MMNITVAGIGYVGLVASACFAEVGHKVISVDIDNSKIEKLKNGIMPIYEPNLKELISSNYNANRLEFTTDFVNAYRNSEVVVIGVGTPSMPDGSANLDYVYEAARQIALNCKRDCVVLVKSTVPIGTNDKIEEIINNNLQNDINIEVVSNPEFLSQGSAINDMINGSRIIVGTNSDKAMAVIREIYRDFTAPIVQVSRRSAEMIKYAANDFLALKISYINEIANLCDLYEADIEQVTKGMSYDERIGKFFLNAGVGFGGSCLPKDTQALIHMAQDKKYHLRTVRAAYIVNSNQKTQLYRKALKRLEDFSNKKVAVLGLTFKEGTDDIREAPAIDNVKLLLESGAHIYAFDPVGIDNFKNYVELNITNQEKNNIPIGIIEYTEDYRKALEDADICFVFTNWGIIQQIKPSEYVEYMKTPLVYDGRNIYNYIDMKNAKVEYYSVGRNNSI
ncbi:MAG: UDP-glucose/GDP-mannose dehydrogenase family protein [Lachnospiraceae bacterium]|nr:UDP-glucose/GDP-mannose dehydrogenase family protein [Lachnospiraceae bacterium]